MGAFNLSSYLWPEAEQARQPQGPVGMAAGWGENCLLSYPVIGLGRESANGRGRFIGIASPDLYKATIGRAGLAFNGNGGVNSVAKGLYTAPEELPYRGLSAMSEFVVFELDSTANSTECTIIRATRETDSKGIAISVFPYNRLIRALFQTTGTTGWSASYDVTESRLKAGVLWGIGVSYISGRRVVYSGPIGGEVGAAVTTAITGTIVDSSSTPGNGALCVGGLNYPGASTIFPGNIYTASFWRGVKTPAEFAALFENPWQIFAPQPIPFVIESGGNIHTITPAGALSLVGSVTQLHEKSLTTTGSVALTGTALLTFTNGATTYTIIPSGSITLSGTNNTNKYHLLVPQGNITLSGNAVERRVRATLPTGSINFSGDTSIAEVRVFSSSGNVMFNGTAQLYMPGMKIETTSILLTGTGV